MHDDGVTAERAGALHFRDDLPGGAQKVAAGDEPGDDADGLVRVVVAHDVLDVAGAWAAGDEATALRADGGPGLV